MTKIPRAEEARHNTEMLITNERLEALHKLISWASREIEKSKTRRIFTSATMLDIANPDALKEFKSIMIEKGYTVDIDDDLNSWGYGRIIVTW